MSVKLSAIYTTRLQDVKVPPELSRQLRRADDFIRLAVVAAFEVLQQKNKDEIEAPENCGLILGSGFGTMQTNFEVLDSVVFGQQCSPILFSHSVFNAAAGYMASIFSFQGCALTVTEFSFPFFRALQEGWLALSSGRLERCLVLQVETYSELLQDARRKHVVKEEGCKAEDWQPGVVCWLLEKNEVTGHRVHCPEIRDYRHQPLEFLQFVEQLTVDGQVTAIHDPLGAATAISDALLEGRSAGRIDCRLLGPRGEVMLQLQKET